MKRTGITLICVTLLLSVVGVLGSCRNPAGPDPITIGFLSLSANGASGVDTTQLTLTFDQEPEGLTTSHITINGGVRGSLGGTGMVRTLSISDISVSNGSPVTVTLESPAGYNYSPASRTVAVFLASTTGNPGNSWITLGQAGFNGAPSSFLSLAGTSNDLYLAYKQGVGGQLQRWNTTTDAWVSGSIDTFYDGNIGQTELRLNNNGEPFVVFAKNLPPTGANAELYTNFMDMTENDWGGYTLISNEILNNGQAKTTLAMDWDTVNNKPVVSFVNTDAGETVMIRDGATLLETVQSKGVATKYVSASEHYMVIVKSNDRPAIMKNGDTNTTDISADGASHICIDAVGGLAYVAFVDLGAANEITVLKNAAGVSPEVLGSRGFTSGTGSITYVSLITRSEDEIYVSYLRDKKVFIEEWNGFTWSSLGQVNDPDINNAGFPVMAYVNDVLYVAYDEVLYNYPSGAPVYVSGGATVKKWGQQ